MKLNVLRLVLHQCLHIGKCIAAHGSAWSVSQSMCKRIIGIIKPNITQFAHMQANIESNLRKMEMGNLAELAQSGFSNLLPKKHNCWENWHKELGFPLDSCHRYGLVGAEYSQAKHNLCVGSPRGPTLQDIFDTHCVRQAQLAGCVLEVRMLPQSASISLGPSECKHHLLYYW